MKNSFHCYPLIWPQNFIFERSIKWVQGGDLVPGFNKGIYEEADQLNFMSLEDRSREKGLS